MASWLLLRSGAPNGSVNVVTHESERLVWRDGRWRSHEPFLNIKADHGTSFRTPDGQRVPLVCADDERVDPQVHDQPWPIFPVDTSQGFQVGDRLFAIVHKEIFSIEKKEACQVRAPWALCYHARAIILDAIETGGAIYFVQADDGGDAVLFRLDGPTLVVSEKIHGIPGAECLMVDHKGPSREDRDLLFVASDTRIGALFAWDAADQNPDCEVQEIYRSVQPSIKQLWLDQSAD